MRVCSIQRSTPPDPSPDAPAGSLRRAGMAPKASHKMVRMAESRRGSVGLLGSRRRGSIDSLVLPRNPHAPAPRAAPSRGIFGAPSRGSVASVGLFARMGGGNPALQRPRAQALVGETVGGPGVVLRGKTVTSPGAPKSGIKVARRDLKKEIWLLTRLRHPNVVTIMGAVLPKSGEPMLVMEYMESGSLFHLIHNRSVDLDMPLILDLLRDIASGESASPPLPHRPG